ncbi:MAG TPA: ATP-binding protein [Rhodothermales bacterium]|nr:ATP-binding protein [Rhodothermales bacterium]
MSYLKPVVFSDLMIQQTMQYSLRVPSDKRYLADVRRFIEAHASIAGFPEFAIEHIKLAVDEACTNIIDHAYQRKNTEAIEVVIAVDVLAFRISLRHRGIPFQREQYHRPQDLRASINARKGGGWGVFLMNKLMDEVDYRILDGYNEVYLVKKRLLNGKS